MSDDRMNVDVRRLPFWDSMHKDVLMIVRAGKEAKEGQAHDTSAAMLAAVVVKHIATACALIGTDEATAFLHMLLESASVGDDYPEDDDAKLDPQDPRDPSAKWDNRRSSVH